MKKLILILPLLILIISGCNTTRKSVQSTVEQQVTQNTNSTTDTHNEKSEAILFETNVSENLNAVVDFTRIEFTDGTTLTDLYSPAHSDTAKFRDREQTEPPNINKSIKAITAGRIDLTQLKDKHNNTTAKSDSKSDISQTTKNNSSFNTTQQEKITEKEKRGFFHWLGIIVGIVIALLIGYFGIRFLLIKK